MTKAEEARNNRLRLQKQVENFQNVWKNGEVEEEPNVDLTEAEKAANLPSRKEAFDANFFGCNNPGVDEKALEEIGVSLLIPFHTGDGHPFEVVDDIEMQELVASIQENGILVPIIVRRDRQLTGRYEIICGHRRTFAAKKLGIEKVPVKLVDYDDVKAIKAMISSNLDQRKKIKPSVKAKAYKMFLEANKRQGKRTDLTSCQVGTKLKTDKKTSDSTSCQLGTKSEAEKNGGQLGTNSEVEKNVCQLGTNLRTDERTAEEFSESARTIQRYAKLTELLPEILQMVDEEKVKFTVGVELADLDKDKQIGIYNLMENSNYRPTLEEASNFKKMEEQEYRMYLSEVAKKKLGAVRKEKPAKINEQFANKYLPVDIRKKTTKQKTEYIKEALIMYNNYLEEHEEEKAKWYEDEAKK